MGPGWTTRRFHPVETELREGLRTLCGAILSKSTPSHGACFKYCWMNRTLRLSIVLAGLALLRVALIPAMTVVETNFDQLLDQAENIYKAQVVSVTCDWSGEGANRHLATFVRVRVLESYRGAVQGEQTLEFFGGKMGERTQRIVGMPEFQTGDVEILFVRGNHTDLCPLVGVYHGRLHVVQSGADGRERIYRHNGAPLTDVSLIGREASASARPAAVDASGAPKQALTAKDFVLQIKDGLKRRGIAADEP